MRVLVACEFSGVVRDAFLRKGHDARSCDLLPSESPGPHYVGDAREYLKHEHWDLLIAHPPCTYLTNAGVRWLYKGGRGTEMNEERWKLMIEAREFFLSFLWAHHIPRIAVENPIPHRHALLPGEDRQIIQPWQFGHGETKATCLWLKNLPPLKPTKIVSGRTPRVHFASPGPQRWKERSRTMQGIAEAMADQWGELTNATA